MLPATGQRIRHVTRSHRFADRHAAGRELGARLLELSPQDPVVLGLARGGVPVAFEVARAIGAPLEVFVVRKIGAPGNPEYGIGAVAEGGALVIDDRAVHRLLVSEDELRGAVAHARAELSQRLARYRDARPAPDLQDRVVIVVDDGLATGGTARAALRAVRAQRPARLILAVPVGAADTVAALREEADEVVCLREPAPFWAVGAWYEDFRPTSDAEIEQLLDGDPSPPADAVVAAHEVQVPIALDGVLNGDLAVPQGASGLVVFAHGSGSSRHSPRNRAVAAELNRRGLATLLLDLLTVEEERDRHNVFDATLLGRRLEAATAWTRTSPLVSRLPVGYFGASTGAAAALIAAAALPDLVRTVVSRGGRPDLARASLADVRVPVLLLVGGHDELVLDLNRQAARLLGGPVEVREVAGATHLFEEPGALEAVARGAGDWFSEHLRVDPAA